MDGAPRSRQPAALRWTEDDAIRSDPTRSADRTELTHPGALEQWIAPEAVRRMIGAWAYAALPETDRPGSAEVRRAIAVSGSLAELALEARRTPFAARASHGGAGTPQLWEVELEADAVRLGELAGYSSRETEAAIELLLRSGALQSLDVSPSAPHASSVTRRVRLAQEAIESAPALGRIEWGGVRNALRGGSVASSAIAAPLAVFREIARASGPIADPAAPPHVRYSVRELEAVTLFSRSTVSEALAVLERAGLVATEARRGQTLRCALAPCAFGISPGTMAAPEHPKSSEPPADESVVALPSHPGQVRTSEPATSTRAVPVGVVRLGEFAGTPIYGPAGTPIVVECDEQGQWTCRVGPHLRLGPIG